MRLIRSNFRAPRIIVDEARLRSHFASQVAAESRPLRNPHHEPRVTEQVMRGARSAAVLIPLVFDEHPPRMLFTRRTQGIRFAGHLCFPGGTRDADDASDIATALRESAEEIGLQSERVRVVGQLGEYFTQTGFHIKPVVGILQTPLQLTAQPGEVAEIIEIPLEKVFDSQSYQLMERMPGRAHFSFEHLGTRIAGPTVSIMMGFYEELLRST